MSVAVFGLNFTNIYVHFRLKLHNAMREIKDYVSEDLHRYIPQSVPTISELRAAPDSSVRINNGPSFPSSSGVSNSNNNQSTTSPEDPSLESLGNIHISTVQKAAESLMEIDYIELETGTNKWCPENRLGQGDSVRFIADSGSRWMLPLR